MKPLSDAFTIREIEGKGLGMIAARDIKLGEIIVREKPLILMPDSVFSSDDPDKIERWLDRKLNKLTSEEREIFFNLSDSRSSTPEDPDNKTPLGIFFTNDMNFFGDAALFPVMARANHACAPNADFICRPELNVQDLVAIKNVKNGEEISLSYLPASKEGSDVRKIRQNYIHHWYGFKCFCNTCSLNKIELEMNDSARQQIRLVQNFISKFAVDEENESELELVFRKFSLKDLEKFLENLFLIECKLPYFSKMCKIVFNRAIEENNIKMAARFQAAEYINDAILNEESKTKSVNDHSPWQF